jgi:signal transduction histidine kinase
MRLTRDLYDGILQTLTAAALQLNLVEQTSDLSRLNIIKQLLTQEQRRLRKFVDKTCPKTVSGTDVVLRPDLRQVIEQTGMNWNCVTSFSIMPADAKVSQFLAGQLSLVLTEAIANAARHGEASTVDVALTKTNGYLDLNIRDNGKGFAEAPISAEHAKPTSICERVRALGGSIDVMSSSTGAELAIRVPAS